MAINAIELIPDKVLKALKALQSVGYTPRLPVALADFADPEIRKSWIRDKRMLVFQLYNEQIHQTVDIFADYPMDFEQLCRDAVPIQLRSASPKIASIDHLIVMKQGAGRPQGLVDIDMLNKLKVLIAERYKT